MMDDNLFLNDQHDVSHRFAVLEDNGTSAWLYLSEPDSQRPVADAWVYNRIEAPTTKEIEKYRGGPPPAAQDFVSGRAHCLSPHDHEWSFIWSSDGESVGVLKDGGPVVFIIAGERRGYSRELVKEGPWGHMWSDELFKENFGSI